MVSEEGVSVARVSGSGEATGSVEVEERAAGEGGWSLKVEKKAKTRRGTSLEDMEVMIREI